jgi:signal peptidase I
MDETIKKSSTRDTFESLVVTVILAIFGTTFVLQAFKIPTGSMENTLLIGDHLLVNKFIFAPQGGRIAHIFPYRDLRRGDVLVFKFSRTDTQQEPGEHFVKRVIGVPGDRIRVFHRQVFVDGKLQSQPFVRYDPDDADVLHPEDDFPRPDGEDLSGSSPSGAAEFAASTKNGELIVPPGKYFVMGDNREQSWDSRFWGFVSRGDIVGRPVVIYWSFETARDEYTHNALSDRISQVVDLVIHFPTKTRWRRTLKLVR